MNKVPGTLREYIRQKNSDLADLADNLWRISRPIHERQNRPESNENGTVHVKAVEDNMNSLGDGHKKINNLTWQRKLARRLGMTQPGVGNAVIKGEAISKSNNPTTIFRHFFVAQRKLVCYTFRKQPKGGRLCYQSAGQRAKTFLYRNLP